MSAAHVPDYGPILSVDSYGPFKIGGVYFDEGWIACTVDYGLEHGTEDEPLPIVSRKNVVEVAA